MWRPSAPSATTNRHAGERHLGVVPSIRAIGRERMRPARIRVRLADDAQLTRFQVELVADGDHVGLASLGLSDRLEATRQAPARRQNEGSLARKSVSDGV